MGAVHDGTASDGPSGVDDEIVAPAGEMRGAIKREL